MIKNLSPIENRGVYASRTEPTVKVEVVDADFSGWVVYEVLFFRAGRWGRDARTRMRSPEIFRSEYVVA